jgi:hypothetical protein
VPLTHGYGVLVGTLDSYARDRPDDQGRWFHDNLTLTAAGNVYRSAVDVDSHQSSTGVQWKTVRADAADLGAVASLQSGYHQLTSARGTGALDHIRSPFTQLWRLKWRVIRFLGISLRVPTLAYQPWKSGTNVQAADALESILVLGQPVIVWGEPFTTGLGMHNVHQNQGDPAGSMWWDENAIWQDGGVAAPSSANKYTLFVSKFSSQSSRTDTSGHPA